MELKIREAALSDAPVIADFNLRLADESEGLRLEPVTVQAGVTAELTDPTKGIYYVAEVEGAVVGQLMITYEWSDWRNGTIWWIQSVYVKPEFRRPACSARCLITCEPWRRGERMCVPFGSMCMPKTIARASLTTVLE